MNHKSALNRLDRHWMGAGLLLTLLLGGTVQPASAHARVERAVTYRVAAADPAAQKLYTTYCGSCHGDSGMGDGKAAGNLQPAPKPLHQAMKGQKDDALIKVLQEGRGQMPGWKNVLKPEQMQQLLNYIKTFGGEHK